MAVLQQLFVLLATLSAVHSQTVLQLASAEVITLVTGSLYPVRSYVGFQKIPLPNSVPVVDPLFLDLTLDQCLRQCVNINGAVAPAGTPACNAVDHITGLPAGSSNCILHYDAPCSIATVLYEVTPAPGAVIHYKIAHLCDPTRVIQMPPSQRFDTTNLPATVIVGSVISQTNAADCGLLCNILVTCIAADYNTVAGCRHFTTVSPSFGACLTTVSELGGSAYQFPCDVAPFSGIKPGLVPNAVAQAATQDDFFTCRGLCLADPECIGFIYNTIREFQSPGQGDPLAARCSLYDKYAVGTSIACQPAVQSLNLFTNLRFPCRFTEFPNMRKVGGIPQPQWRTLYECERECHFNMMCTGYDWNTDANTLDRERCWFHTEYRGGCENRRDTTMVDSFELIDSRCSINADDYFIFLGVQVTGTGTTLAAATTYAACLAACNNEPTCEGFDFILATTTCIWHAEATVCTSMTPNADAVHYRKRRYHCMWRFRNAKRSGGVAQMGVTILGNCERECRQTVGCEGFDFDRTGRVPGTPCFLHLTGTVCNPLVRASDIEHYRIRTRVCPNEENIIAIANWGNAMQNVHTIGNARQGVEQSAIECAETCVRLGNRQCAGVDYDRRTGFCYIVTRDKACNPTGAVLDNVDRIQLPTGCNAPTVTGYLGTATQHRVKGQLRDSSSTPFQCAVQCSNDPLCGSFDFDRTNNECWTHSQTQECRNQQDIFNNNCCDHYVNSTLNCNSYNPPTFLLYTLRNEVHVVGGSPAQDQLNIVTERQCVAHCTSRSDCVSVDFNFALNICYVHTSVTGCNAEASNLQVHRYIKNGNCGTTI